jgi:hypothetical protein
MRKMIYAAMAALSASMLSGCYYMDTASANDQFESGLPISTNWTKTDRFSALGASGPDKIIFKTGDVFQIKAEGDADVIKRLRFVVSDGKIRIGRKSGSDFGMSEAAIITVTAPSLSAIALAGSGDIVADRLSGKEATLKVAGSGNASVDSVETEVLVAKIAGSGQLKLAGKSPSADYVIAGSGGLDAGELQSETVKIRIAGSGDATLKSTTSVNAKIAGSGNVKVTGGAKCTSSVAGSGSLDCG